MYNLILFLIILLILIFFYKNINNKKYENFQAAAPAKCPADPHEALDDKFFFKNPYCVSYCLNEFIEIDKGAGSGAGSGKGYEENKCIFRPKNYNSLENNINKYRANDPVTFLKKLNGPDGPDHKDLPGPYNTLKSDETPKLNTGIYPRFELLGINDIARFNSSGCAACIANFYNSLKAIRCANNPICSKEPSNIDDPCYECDCNNKCNWNQSVWTEAEAETAAETAAEAGAEAGAGAGAG